MVFSRIELNKFLDLIISQGLEQDLEEFCVKEGVDRRTPDSILSRFKEDRNEFDKGKAPNKNTMKAFYKYQMDNLGDAQLYHELKKRLGSYFQDQNVMKAFCGTYFSYYVSEDHEYQRGTIDIDCNEQNVFTYTSYTQFSGESKNVKHAGFVFIIGSHLYLTGMGSNFSRPFMIEITDKDVKRDFLHGIVLSVTSESMRIFARRVMLHHKDCETVPYGTLTDEQIMKELADATSEHTPMMLHVKK